MFRFHVCLARAFDLLFLFPVPISVSAKNFWSVLGKFIINQLIIVSTAQNSQEVEHLKGKN